MLRLFYGRENRNKDQFLFDGVRRVLACIKKGNSGTSNDPEKILLIVPDQFTLQAEQNAFTYLDVPGLMDLEVISQSRLGYRILEETGGGVRKYIDKHGRHMVLSGIIRRLEKELTAYRGVRASESFIEKINDFITELKQNNVGVEMLAEALGQMEKDSLLFRKLADVQKIYARYEDALSGKYIDNEDYMELVVRKISQSDFIGKSEIWIYGFETFTEKSVDMIGALMKRAIQLNVILTADGRKGRDEELFAIGNKFMVRFEKMASEIGIAWEKHEIPEKYNVGKADGLCEKSAGLVHLEQELYAYPYDIWEGEDGEGISLCRAANLYAEVETAAARIVELTRDEGLSYKEIAVICNDMEKYGSIIKRVFSLYDIPVFLDEKRGVLHHPAVEFIASLLDIVIKGWRYEDIFRFFKTDLYDVEDKECALLENYAIQYRISGNRWKSKFKYGVSEYGEEGLAKLNEWKDSKLSPLVEFEIEFKRAETVKEKSFVLYHYLTLHFRIPDHLSELIACLEDRGELEAAEEISQTWAVVTELLDQMVELAGDEKISNEEYYSMLQAGFASVEIGLLPPSQDRIIVGTMQRSRRGETEALLVLGANDGLLPAGRSREELLSEMEVEYLAEREFSFCRREDDRLCEERLAIYKNLSSPKKFLWMSYPVSDIDGREKKPSLIFDKLMQIFPDIPVASDILNSKSDLDRMQTVKAAFPHMGEVFRGYLAGEQKEISEDWKLAYDLIKNRGEKERTDCETMQKGLFFTNHVKNMEEVLVNRLYKKEGMSDFILSPSRLERFGKCPFAHFVQYGLSPKERRVFEVAGRESGDIYHQCLMELSMELTSQDIAVTDPTSPWMTWSKEQCSKRVEELIDRISLAYREGVLTRGEEEDYRRERMKKIAIEAAWMLISHVRKGKIENVFFEVEFGDSPQKPFPSIVLPVGENSVRIEGKIDRVDVLRGGEGESSVKIIDYKSGNEKFRKEEALEGIRLQLMLYLEGAMAGVKNSEPAGIFYFKIAEPLIEADGFSEEELGKKVEVQFEKSFRMDGIMIDDPTVVNAIAGDFSGYSEIVPLRSGTQGIAGTSEERLLSQEDFQEFRNQINQVVQNLCKRLISGDVKIHPKKTKYQNACRYCQLKGICCFDLSFEDCKYR